MDGGLEAKIHEGGMSYFAYSHSPQAHVRVDTHACHLLPPPPTYLALSVGFATPPLPPSLFPRRLLSYS